MEQFYFICALIGFTVLLFKLVLSLFGLEDSLDLDFDGDVDFESFTFFSVQNVSIFFTMFGLVGMATLFAGFVWSLISGLVAGCTSMLIISYILYSSRKLTAKGNLDYSTAVGQVGTVYISISPNKPGQVQVAISGRLTTVDAVSDRELPAGSKVKVVEVSDNVVKVENVGVN